jgi:hypothetical protein
MARLLVFEVYYGHEKSSHYQEYAADHHRRIGHVEGWPALKAKETIELEGQEVYDSFWPEYAVTYVSQAAAYDAAHGPTLQACQLIGPEHVDAQANQQSQGHYDEYGHPGKLGHVVTQAEGCTGILLVNQPEEVVKGGPGYTAGRNASCHHQFGKLVQQDYDYAQ